MINDKKSVFQICDFTADFHLKSPVSAILNDKDMLSIKPNKQIIQKQDEIQKAVRVCF